MSDTDVVGASYAVDRPVGKSGPQIRAALDEDRRAEFEGEFRAALAAADDDLDLAGVQAVLDRWWPVAVLAANPHVQVGVDADRGRLAVGDSSVLGVPTVYPHRRPAA